MGLFDWMFGKKVKESSNATGFKIITDIGEGFYSWDGNIYKSDIVRSCIRPKARALGKLMAQHVRETETGLQINPNKDIKMLLEEPNPLMSGQMLREKLATQLELNNNAFAIIKRDPETFFPYEIYPVTAASVEMLEGPQGEMYLKFYFYDGKNMVVPYVDVIHLRKDFNSHNLFGDHPGPVLSELMDVVTTIDQGMKKAIKSSALIKWILKFKSILKPEDVTVQVNEFVDRYLSVESKGGAAASDPRYDLEQVKNNNFVPDDKQTKNITQRIYDFFNTNDRIVQSRYDENEWNAYYEAVIEPDALQLSSEYTRKIFTRRERGHGNKIVFESLNLQYASMRTKLNLVQFVDRAMMTPNEVRRIFNMGPIEGGDKPIRRLDTAPIDEGGEDDGKNGNKGTDDEQD
ncbi:phage portal protein [Bacillus sp. VT-16-64]|nr:phage portal protein [Bacillus sp. VT-16-64]